MVEPGYVVTYDGVERRHAVVLSVDDEALVLYVPDDDKCAEMSRELFHSRDQFFARRMVKSEIAKLTTSKGANLAERARKVYVNE